MKSYNLKSFYPSDYKVRVEVVEDESDLGLSYSCRNAPRLIFAYSSDWERLDGLHESTCLELFIKNPQGRYLEWNISPGRGWQNYLFEGYRSPVSLECPVEPQVVAAQLDAVDPVVQVRIPKGPIIETLGPRPGWSFNLSAILQTVTGRLDYWAVHHGIAKPDFHDPSRFFRIEHTAGAGG